MAERELLNGEIRKLRHDMCAANCTNPLLIQDPDAHCPRCCPREDHRIIPNDHMFKSVSVSRWAHADEVEGAVREPPKQLHNCAPPTGFGEHGDILTCQTCKAQWMYVTPYGMDPHWQMTRGRTLL